MKTINTYQKNQNRVSKTDGEKRKDSSSWRSIFKMWAQADPFEDIMEGWSLALDC